MTVLYVDAGTSLSEASARGAAGSKVFRSISLYDLASCPLSVVPMTLLLLLLVVLLLLLILLQILLLRPIIIMLMPLLDRQPIAH